MKKYLFVILLSLICIIPFKVYAFVVPPNDYANYYLYPSGLTNEQKNMILDYVKNDSNYLSYCEAYPYHIIVFHNGIVPYQYNYSNRVLVFYFNDIPTLSNTFDTYMTIDSSVQSKIIGYSVDLNNNTFSFSSSYSLGALKLFYMDSNYKISVGEYGSAYAYYGDVYLYSNFNLKPLWNFNLYDLDSNLIKTYTTEDYLFNFEEEEKEYTIEDIFNSKDTLYSLSKELIGPLPEEFKFIYSIVSLMLGLLVLIVIISPFVILKRWLM